MELMTFIRVWYDIARNYFRYDYLRVLLALGEKGQSKLLHHYFR
jgi:hypothetical protein